MAETKGEQSSGSSLPQRERKHPDDLERSLNPSHMAGQNVGPGDLEREIPLQSAYDVKELHRRLSDFSDDDLKQIPILPAGMRLEQGATYVDLADERPSEVRVNGAISAREGQYMVPKNKVPYTVWNRLVGEAKPGQERSGAADRGAEPRAGRDETGGADWSRRDPHDARGGQE